MKVIRNLLSLVFFVLRIPSLLFSMYKKSRNKTSQIILHHVLVFGLINIYIAWEDPL